MHHLQVICAPAQVMLSLINYVMQENAGEQRDRGGAEKKKVIIRSVAAYGVGTHVKHPNLHVAMEESDSEDFNLIDAEELQTRTDAVAFGGTLVPADPEVNEGGPRPPRKWNHNYVRHATKLAMMLIADHQERKLFFNTHQGLNDRIVDSHQSGSNYCSAAAAVLARLTGKDVSSIDLATSSSTFYDTKTIEELSNVLSPSPNTVSVRQIIGIFEARLPTPETMSKFFYTAVNSGLFVSWW